MLPSSPFPLAFASQVIARRYIRGWLTLDVFSIFPSAFDIIPVVEAAMAAGAADAAAAAAEGEVATGSPVKALRVVRALRLIKLVRLLRASRVLGRLEVSCMYMG